MEDVEDVEAVEGLGMSTSVLDGKTSDCFRPKFYVINV